MNETSNEAELRRLLLADFHRLMVEALRLREQEVLRYIAILAPALAGFFWLLMNRRCGADPVFIYGTIGVVLLLGTGAAYAVALGYNFRSIILQIAKIRKLCCIRPFVLNKWPGTPEDFKNAYGTMCYPPEIIGVFWLSFIVFMVGVIITAAFRPGFPCWATVVCSIIVSIAVLVPLIRYGTKLRNVVDAEEEGFGESPFDCNKPSIGDSGQ